MTYPTSDPLTTAIRADRAMKRASALTLPCDYCKAQVGYECADPTTGTVLVKQPAHNRRLRDAGVG